MMTHSTPALRLLLAGLLLAAAPALALADRFLQPQVLPPDLRQLTMNDSETGESFVIRLDENHLPVTEDFFGEQDAIPFSMTGELLESASGGTLHAWTVIPKQNSNGIAVLLLHGNGGNILTNLGAGVELAKRGYRTTLVDYSGYGWSTGEANRDNVLVDGKIALETFSDRAREAGETRLLFGQSLGGHLAVVLAADHPARLDALAIEGAFTSHRDMAAFYRGAIARAFVSEPYSAEKRMPEVRAPVLVVHSTDDTVVPFTMGEELFALANEPKAFLEIDGPHLAGIAAHGDALDEAFRALAKQASAGVMSAGVRVKGQSQHERRGLSQGSESGVRVRGQSQGSESGALRSP